MLLIKICVCGEDVFIITLYYFDCWAIGDFCLNASKSNLIFIADNELAILQKTYVMPPFYFVSHRSCVHFAVEVDVCSFPDVFRSQRGTQVDGRFRNICKKMHFFLVSR
jgi:hypothetical protein